MEELKELKNLHSIQIAFKIAASKRQDALQQSVWYGEKSTLWHFENVLLNNISTLSVVYHLYIK